MDKFSDNLRLTPPGTFRPTTVSALLRSLDLVEAPESKKVTAIRDWLQHHEPSPLMERSLRRGGFADLLRRSASA